MPAVTGVQPDAGLVEGGTPVTITGSDFSGALTVDFGSREAREVEVNSPTSISAVAPAGAGTVNVTVTSSGGTSAISPVDHFTYVAPGPPPSVKKLEPGEGPTAGGTLVSITGQNFSGVTAVTFGATAASGFTVSSKTSILAISPAEPQGTVQVSVTTPNGTSASVKKDQFSFSEAAPESGPLEPAGLGEPVAR